MNLYLVINMLMFVVCKMMGGSRYESLWQAAKSIFKLIWPLNVIMLKLKMDCGREPTSPNTPQALPPPIFSRELVGYLSSLSIFLFVEFSPNHQINILHELLPFLCSLTKIIFIYILE